MEEDVSNNFKERLKCEEKAKVEIEQKLVKSIESQDVLNTKVESLENELHTMVDEKQTIAHEVDVLKDCLLQFKGVREGLREEGDDEIDEDELLQKQKEKLLDLIDVSRVQRRLKLVETEKGSLHFDLEAERKAREENHELLSKWEAKYENELSIKCKVERELQMLQAKLNVMQDYYAKRDVEMQGKLGKEQSCRESTEMKLAEKDEKTSQFEQMLEDYKTM
uniref:Uncharacterized protein n=1 Tax=Ciona savignyi TaxID=51511 RepID=H2YCI1_CIOSA